MKDSSLADSDRLLTGLLRCVQLYKLNQDAALAGVEAGSAAERQAVDGAVVGAVALKVVT